MPKEMVDPMAAGIVQQVPLKRFGEAVIKGIKGVNPEWRLNSAQNIFVQGLASVRIG